MDVYFEAQKGKCFSIEVGFFDTVFEIKEKIQKYEGIPISKQTLIFNNRVLQDHLDVQHCEILQNSRIQLIVTPLDNNHHVKTEPPPSTPRDGDIKNNNNNNNYEVDVSVKSSPTTRSSTTTSTTTNMMVGPNCNGRTTNNNNNRKKLTLMVLAKCGTKKIPVEVNASDNVGELRKELGKLHQRLHLNLPQEDYFFIYKQNVMDDDRSFRWHQVSQGDTIEIFNGSVSGGT